MHHLAYSNLFARSRDTAEQPVRSKQSWDGQRNSFYGNLLDCSKAAVIDLLLTADRVESDRLYGDGIIEVSRRVVEGEMTVYSNSKEDYVDRRFTEQTRVAAACLNEVAAWAQ